LSVTTLLLATFVSLALLVWGVPAVAPTVAQAAPLAGAQAQAQTPAAQLTALAKQVDVALARVAAGDQAGAQAAYKAFDTGWFDIEDGIRAESRASYRAIEDAMAGARSAVEATPFDTTRARQALERLRGECDAFIAGKPPLGQPAAGAAAPAAAPAGTGSVTLTSLVAHLDRASARLDAADPAGAAAEVDAFRRDWTEVEGQVKAKSAQAYRDTENNMALAYSQLTQRRPDTAAARATLARLKSDLAPYAEQPSRYGLFDAAAILLREGLEALLVVGALLAFLAKTGNADKGRWIWAGSGAGILASMVVAVVISVLFSRAAAGANRELLEGITGLVAAGMLVYVSYWLHSKASLGAWQRYVRETTSAALARNSLFGLAVIAFLAVFREGAETALFYLGIASSIAFRDLVLGLALGAAGLAVLGVAMLVFGVRLPIRPFFLVTSVLVYYLAFKFIGTGIHALQVAGVVHATPSSLLPENGVLGLFPTWETTAVQAGLALLALAVVLVQRLPRGRRAATAPAVMAVLSLLLGACGATASLATAPNATGAPTAAARSNATAPAGAARKEVELVKQPRVALANTLEALKRNDVAAAKAAFAAYDPAWNGIEVYVNFRSRSTPPSSGGRWRGCWRSTTRRSSFRRPAPRSARSSTTWRRSAWRGRRCARRAVRSRRATWPAPRRRTLPSSRRGRA
jgi:high-affinity iron transporter